MSASVVSLSMVRQRVGFRRWSNQDIAEIYRVADALRRAGLPIDCDEGETDEGDPWYAFCNVNTGDVIVHFACIDGRYVAEVGHLGVSFRGDTLSDIVGQFLNSYPVILPNNQDKGTRVWMHPASGLVAFIATLYFLLEMTQSAEARGLTADGVAGGDVVDGSPSDELAFSEILESYVTTVRDQNSRSSRGDGTTMDGGRAVAVSAAILIAGVLMDWHRTSDKPIAFEPESVLDAILNNQGEDLGEEIILALKSMAGFETAADGSRAPPGDASAVRTAHSVRAENDIEVVDGETVDISRFDSEEGLVIDLDGEFGESGRAIGAELHRDDVEVEAESIAAAKKAGREGTGEERPEDTIAATVTDGEEPGAVESGDVTDPNSGTYFEEGALAGSGDPEFLDAAVTDSSTVTLLQSLGLKDATSSGTPFEADVDSLVQLIASPSDVSSSSTTPLAQSGAGSDSAGSSVSPAPIGPTVSGSQAVPGIDPGASAGNVPAASAPSPAPTLSQPTVIEVAQVLGHANSHEPTAPTSETLTPIVPEVRELDFSIFDPVEVLQLFVQSIEKVGFAHLEEIFYLYDAVTIATTPGELEIEQLHLENGDEVNLLGQAETFDAIYEALA